MRKTWLVLPLLLTSCAPQIVPAGSPAPYQSAAPDSPPAPNVIVIVETPKPTSTPYVYTIQEGDTFSELAEQFRIPQDELQAANPEISPHSMPIGRTLLIPDLSALPAAAQPPTPEPVPITQVLCHPSADAGLWCFALIQNLSPNPLDAVSAQINLLDESGNTVASQSAFAPLSFIPPGDALPVYAFFADMPASLKPQARLLSAIQTDANSPRYRPVTLGGVATQIVWNGRTSRVSGQAVLPPEAQAATRIWIAAVAYDKDGRVVGLKRWEGSPPQFTFTISSLSAPIQRVEFFAEAQP